jgi:putative transposase
MARQLRIEFAGAFYHVTSRGNQKQAIVQDDQDRGAFLDYLDKAHEKFGGIIHAFCLMDNHFHLLIETPRGNLSKFMHFIKTSYSLYFNARYSRVGHLFQGRFKAILIEADSYAQAVSRYIHLNPVRAGLIPNPDDYRWSSLGEYAGLRPPLPWLRTDFILSYFGDDIKSSRSSYLDFVRAAAGAVQENPAKNAGPILILGSASFVEEIKAKIRPERWSGREVPAAKRLLDRPTLGEIRNAVGLALGEENLFTRNASIYITHAKFDYPLKEIATFYSLSHSAIGFITRKMRKNLEWNIVVKNVLDHVEKELSPLQGKRMEGVSGPDSRIPAVPKLANCRPGPNSEL